MDTKIGELVSDAEDAEVPYTAFTLPPPRERPAAACAQSRLNSARAAEQGSGCGSAARDRCFDDR